jgi:hypothetical protein
VREVIGRGEGPFLILEALYAFPAKSDHLVTREMVRETLSVITLCVTREVPDNESQFGAPVDHLTETIRKAREFRPQFMDAYAALNIHAQAQAVTLPTPNSTCLVQHETQIKSEGYSGLAPRRHCKEALMRVQRQL